MNVNEEPRAGLMDVAENRERGLVGTLVAWAFNTCSQPRSAQERKSDEGLTKVVSPWV